MPAIHETGLDDCSLCAGLLTELTTVLTQRNAPHSACLTMSSNTCDLKNKNVVLGLGSMFPVSHFILKLGRRDGLTPPCQLQET